MCLGVLWHTLVFVLMGGPLSDAISSFPGMLGGAVAGLCAGYLTFSSRMRHQGRESTLDAVLTYYVAAVIYSLVCMVIRDITGVTHLSGGEFLSSLVGSLWITVSMATLMGVILIPFCFATRFVFWEWCCRRPSNVEDASGADDLTRWPPSGP
jgi:fructose-specific phosphotransferase system IIC component